MYIAQQTTEWESLTLPPRPRARRINSDTRRRQEEDTDDRPMMPVRSSAIVETDDDNNMISAMDLYPTISNLERNGVAVGLPLNNTTNERSNVNDNNSLYRTSLNPIDSNGNFNFHDQQTHHRLPASPPRRQSQVAAIPPDWNSPSVPARRNDSNNGGTVATINRRPRQRPQTVTVPQRGIRRCLSAVTMSSGLVSFDGSEFAAIPAADDYMDDDQLQEYLDQLAKEEARKNRERESLKSELFAASSSAAVNTTSREERDSLRQLLQQLDCGAGGGASNEEDYEAYLDRLMEEQMQAEEQCKSSVARRVSDMSI